MKLYTLLSSVFLMGALSCQEPKEPPKRTSWIEGKNIENCSPKQLAELVRALSSGPIYLIDRHLPNGTVVSVIYADVGDNGIDGNDLLQLAVNPTYHPEQHNIFQRYEVEDKSVDGLTTGDVFRAYSGERKNEIVIERDVLHQGILLPDVGLLDVRSMYQELLNGACKVLKSKE